MVVVAGRPAVRFGRTGPVALVVALGRPFEKVGPVGHVHPSPDGRTMGRPALVSGTAVGRPGPLGEDHNGWEEGIGGRGGPDQLVARRSDGEAIGETDHFYSTRPPPCVYQAISVPFSPTSGDLSDRPPLTLSLPRPSSNPDRPGDSLGPSKPVWSPPAPDRDQLVAVSGLIDPPAAVRPYHAGTDQLVARSLPSQK